MPEKLKLHKARVVDLKDSLLQLLEVLLKPKQQTLQSLLCQPECLVGEAVEHTWRTDTQDVSYTDGAAAHNAQTNEFELKDIEEGDVGFLTHAEMITDLFRIDLVLVSK